MAEASVTVPPGMTVFLPGGVGGFGAGSTVSLPPDHAGQLGLVPSTAQQKAAADLAAAEAALAAAEAETAAAQAAAAPAAKGGKTAAG